MCAVSEWEKGIRARDLALEHFCAILDSQPGLVEIKLQGLGEPLLLGDDFFQMIKAARKRRIWVRTTTNASRLHVHDNAVKLINSGVNEVQISIDGATKETFESIRRQSHFKVVVNNCTLINRICDERERPVTKSWTVVQSANLHELEQIVALVRSLGFRSHVFSLDLHGWGDAHLSEVNAAKRVDAEIPRNRLEALINLGEKQGLKVEFWNINEKFSTASVNELCPWPFERSFISSDERTVPCCMISNPDVFELGKGLDFASAWHGSQYEQFRKAHLSGDIPRVCRSCYK
jgi:pyrroloquinoline quinone biosynthesis protein E